MPSQQERRRGELCCPSPRLSARDTIPDSRYHMLLCKKIKIEVSERDAEALEFMQDKCQGCTIGG